MKYSIYAFTIFGVIGLASTVGEPAQAGSGEPQSKRIQSSESMEAQRADIRKYDPRLKRMKALSCAVHGTPVEFPNDIAITNLSANVIPSGTTINWAVNSSIKGNHELPTALNPKQTIHLSNVVGGGLPAGTSCSASPMVRSSR